MNPSLGVPTAYGVWGSYGSDVTDGLRDGTSWNQSRPNAMQMHSNSVPQDDFLGVGPWLDDHVDPGSFLPDGPMDPGMPIMNKAHNPYVGMNNMHANASAMMYGGIPEPQPNYPYGGYVDASHSISGGPSSPSVGSNSLHDTSSSSSPASPASPPPPATPNSPLSIELLHKPRGSAGQWRSIVGKQRVRVTHGRGKNMRMLVRAMFEPLWDSLKLVLMEKEDAWADASQDLWSIEDKRPLEETLPDGSRVWVLQIDLKLYAIHKVVAFRAALSPLNDASAFTANSSVMSTHNSGRRDVRGKGADDDDDDVEEQDQPVEEPPSRKEKRQKRNSPERATAVVDNSSFAESMMPPSKQAKTTLVQTPAAARAHPSALAHAVPQQVYAAQQAPSYPPQPAIDYQMPQPPPDPASQPWQTVAGNLQVDGVVRARAFLQYSDMRLKTDISEITDALNIIMSLKGKTYKWKKDLENPAAGQTGGQRVIGLIAQEVQKVLPEVVKETEDGWLSVNYVEIIPVLVEAFKQHTRDFDHFKGGVESNIRDMKADMAALTTLTTQLQAQRDMPDGAVLSELEGMSKHVSRMQEILKARRAANSAQNSPNAARVAAALDNAPDSPLVSHPDSDSSVPLNKRVSTDLSASAADASASSTVSTSSSADASDSSGSRLIKAKPHQPSKGSGVATVVVPNSSEPVSIQVHVTSRDNTWKIIAGILTGVILLGAIVGIVLGVRGTSPAPPPAPTWSSNVLGNPSFEDIDPTTGKAVNWDGDYDLLVFDGTKKRAPDPVPCNDASPLECWDTVNKTNYKQVSGLQPDVGRTVLMMVVRSNATQPTYAYQIVAPDPTPAAGAIKMLNVTARVMGEFVVRALPRNSNFTSPSLELDVFIQYVGIGRKDLTRIQFNPRQTKWQTGNALVPVKSQYQLQYVHIQLWQTAVGTSFWDDIVLSYQG